MIHDELKNNDYLKWRNKYKIYICINNGLEKAHINVQIFEKI